MVNQELTNYIQQSLTAGIKKEDIINTLVNIGWQRIDVDEAFRQLEGAGPLYRFQPHIPAPAIEVKAKKKGLILKVFLFIFVISLVAGGSWAYYYFIQHPQLAFRQMPDRMADVEISKYQFALTPTVSLGGIYKQDSREYLDEIISKFKFHKRYLAKIKSLAKRETIGNVKVYHYDLMLDEEAAEWLAQSVYETELGKNYEEFSQQEKEYLEKIIKNIREAAPKIQKIDAYIGQSDLYLYRLDLIYDNKNISLKLSDFDNVLKAQSQELKSIKEIFNDLISL